MQMGRVGLGRMGANMVRRLTHGGHAAVDEGGPAHVLSAALYERFSSRGKADFADQLLAAVRYQLAGHVER